MSLNPCSIEPVPEETARVARAAFPKGNRYMTMRDVLGIIYTNDQFADLYPPVGQYAQHPWRLVLVTLMPLSENLTDRQTADAVRGRIDWKYA
jgi:transposase